MQTFNHNKSYAANTDEQSLSIDLLRGFKVHIKKEKALVILNNIPSQHKIMLSAEHYTGCYFVIGECDVPLFSYMANIYNAPFEVVPVADIITLHDAKNPFSISGDKELSGVLF